MNKKEKTRINVSMTYEMLEAIDQLAESVGIKRNAYVTMILKQHIDSQAVLEMTKSTDMDKEAMVEMLENMKQLVQQVPQKEDNEKK